VFSASEFHTFNFIRMATRRLEEDEIENQLLWDTNSDCFTESEDGAPGSGSEKEQETGPKHPPPPPQPSSSSSSLWGPPQHDRRGSNNFAGGAVGVNLNAAPHVNKDSTPLCVFMLYFTAIIHLLVVDTNRYYHQYLGRLDDGSSPRPDVTDSEMFLFLGIVIQMGHDI
jgi:hypothetical protein